MDNIIKRGRPPRAIPRKKIGLSVNDVTDNMLNQMAQYSYLSKSKIIDIVVEKQYAKFIKEYKVDKIIKGVTVGKNI